MLENYSDVEFSWLIVPTHGHRYMGSAKRMISLMKRELKRKLNGLLLTTNELVVKVTEVANILNTRLLLVENAEGLEIKCITP